MEKIWQLAEQKYDKIIQQILYNRGIFIEDEEEVAKFLQPDFEQHLHDPFLVPGISKAVKRIMRAKENKEKIGIFADYDADGIPGAALLYKTLTKMGLEATAYIPDRESGYGLSQEGIEYLKSHGCSLVITIDLGIKSVKEAEYCQKNNIDLIITDHHLIGDVLPSALTVVHPRLPGSKYPFQDLCGCGVVYKLVWALSKYFKEIDESFLKWNLDLVTISTIADVVPLTGENRVIAKYGLMVLRKTKNLGLKSLYKVSGIKPENINTYTIGFQVAPRINAPGRIDHATKSFELLVTDEPAEAEKLAEWLNEKNNDRQSEMDRIISSTILEVEDKQLQNNNILVVSGPWQRGVIGPSASRLVDKYNLPVVVFSREGEEITGSARSVEGVNIVNVLDSASKYLEKYGGHSGAAGLTLKPEKYEALIQHLIHWANANLDKRLLTKKIKVDAEVRFNDLNKTLCREIEKLEPFGMGNPKPILLLKGIAISWPRRVGKEEKHLSFYAEDGRKKIKSIYFNCPNDFSVKSHIKYDILFNIGLDTWNGEEKVSLNIIDIKETSG